MEKHEIAQRLIINLAQCEPEVQSDVLRRCSDWLQFGGELDDPYFMRQVEFTDRHLSIMRAKKV